MLKENHIYLTTINVPRQFLSIDNFILFVEIRAELIHADEGIPVFSVTLNNLNYLVAACIDWNKMNEYINNIVSIHFAEVLKP